MNSNGKNKIPPLSLTVDMVEKGAGLIELGKRASLSIITDNAAHFVVIGDEVVQVSPVSIINLNSITEEQALQICVLLGYSDAEMEKLLDARDLSLSTHRDA